MKDEDLLLNTSSNNMPAGNVNPLDYPIVKCSKCGGITFMSRLIMRRIPGMLAGMGTEDMLFPMKVLVCDKCGKILDDDVKLYKLDELEQNEKEIIC